MIKAAITDKELTEKLDTIEKDGMTVFVMADGQFRGALYNGTRMVNQMRQNHHLGILETLVLGQAELCAALLIQTMKGREHLTFRYDTNGPAAGFAVEADSTGYVRGHLFQNPIPVEKPLENWNLAPFFGDGTLTISRLGEGMKQAQTGTVEIMHRNIAKDLAWYFAQSEQVHTAFNTSIQFDKQGRVIGAGALFLQAVPGAGGKSKTSAQTADSGSEDKDSIATELIGRVENAFRACPSLGTWFSENGKREDIIHGLFREFSPVSVLDRDIIFDCPCSEAHFVDAVRHLPKAELEDILKNDSDPLEITCHNCGSVYHIHKDQLR
ncbi:MAG: Hsp33 family molecular chaperone HslO [Treponema sp.]|nr:Hsp33 family molecular chaperone HslO [Treponema sp.]